MGSFSIWHWLILILMVYLTVAPAWRIARRAGFSGAWAFIMFVPLLNLVAIWVFSLVKWPAMDKLDPNRK